MSTLKQIPLQKKIDGFYDLEKNFNKKVYETNITHDVRSERMNLIQYRDRSKEPMLDRTYNYTFFEQTVDSTKKLISIFNNSALGKGKMFDVLSKPFMCTTEEDKSIEMENSINLFKYMLKTIFNIKSINVCFDTRVDKSIYKETNNFSVYFDLLRNDSLTNNKFNGLSHLLNEDSNTVEFSNNSDMIMSVVIPMRIITECIKKIDIDNIEEINELLIKYFVVAIEFALYKDSYREKQKYNLYNSFKINILSNRLIKSKNLNSNDILGLKGARRNSIISVLNDAIVINSENIPTSIPENIATSNDGDINRLLETSVRGMDVKLYEDFIASGQIDNAMGLEVSELYASQGVSADMYEEYVKQKKLYDIVPNKINDTKIFLDANDITRLKCGNNGEIFNEVSSNLIFARILPSLMYLATYDRFYKKDYYQSLHSLIKCFDDSENTITIFYSKDSHIFVEHFRSMNRLLNMLDFNTYCINSYSSHLIYANLDQETLSELKNNDNSDTKQTFREESIKYIHYLMSNYEEILNKADMMGVL